MKSHEIAAKLRALPIGSVASNRDIPEHPAALAFANRSWVAVEDLEKLLEWLEQRSGLLLHEPGYMAGWAEVGVVYKDTQCSCRAGVFRQKIAALIAQAKGEQP